MQDLANINSLHCGFHGIGAATVDFRDEIYYGHPPGGVEFYGELGMTNL